MAVASGNVAPAARAGKRNRNDKAALDAEREAEREARESILAFEREMERLEREGWPGPLVKAVADSPWSYALCHRRLGWIKFSGASDGGNGWLKLEGDGGSGGDALEIAGAPGWFPRGLYIRLADVVCVADAPMGS